MREAWKCKSQLWLQKKVTDREIKREGEWQGNEKASEGLDITTSGRGLGRRSNIIAFAKKVTNSQSVSAAESVLSSVRFLIRSRVPLLVLKASKISSLALSPAHFTPLFLSLVLLLRTLLALHGPEPNRLWWNIDYRYLLPCGQHASPIYSTLTDQTARCTIFGAS